MLKSILSRFLGPRPVAFIRTSPEISSRYRKDSASYIGQKMRFAGCGGVVWPSPNRILTLNLLGNALSSYAFDPDGVSCTLLNQPALEGLYFPENLALSSDRRLLAVSNSRDGSLVLYKSDPESGLVEPKPLGRFRNELDRNVHGVCFAPNKNLLYVTTVDKPGFFRVLACRHNNDGGVDVSEIQHVANSLPPLKPKGVSVSQDGRFLAVAYGRNARSKAKRALGRLEIRRLHPDGTIDSSPPVSVLTDKNELGCAEDVMFFPGDRSLLVTDQDQDRAAVVAFDPKDGQLGTLKTWIDRRRGRLSFPHGCAVSPDGNHFSIANYGSDEVNIFRRISD